MRARLAHLNSCITPNPHMTTVAAYASALLLLAPPMPQSGPDSLDLLRITEAYRLTTSVQESVWPGGWGPLPFPVLLVTQPTEYLIADRRTPPGFTASPSSLRPDLRILERPRQFEPNLLAAFPAFGPPSVVVIGQPQATRKRSVEWVLTLVHEHFHQYQSADPSYFAAVERLDLSGGDQTGMWMLNYPFPYGAPAVAEGFDALSRELAQLLQSSTPDARRAFWDRYTAFLDALAEKDRRYLSFQAWQEGVARYVELRTAEAAARSYTPSPNFVALPDFAPFAQVAARMRETLLQELRQTDFATKRRTSFYAFGAGLALLLDDDAPDWKMRYLTEPFALERYRIR